MNNWEEITREEFHQIINDNGGIDNLTVFGVYTELEGLPAIGDSHIASQDDVYTEWGRRGDEQPLVSERRQGRGVNEQWTFRKLTSPLKPELEN